MAGSLEEARRELDARKQEPSGLLRINAPVFFGQRHIAPGLPGLTERYPRLSIELTLTDDYIDPHRDAADLIFRIGMLTDSRSFLSYTRHEYFRRIMCELIGGWVENGEYPADMKSLKEIVQGISYYNAVKYFGFNL